ncbi:restriction endonuclease subunit S [Neisseria meningitidis]|uniref:restriction endonuclease subunit S n=3 Tax=Neisseria meningitidis TaxID=487 RepID=UPI000C32FA8B|nr:restriction endonuclease subunit S [Neisseria meningitidis]MBG8615027.1 restriction endonuclease subunit S [Neisseria meningitidis]MBG8782861.1 restriction endonuclease subunit S [Neisseria meningitidis]MBG8810260.1 restriction endonuclease subunit S [Neisseria meningitidis]MBG8812357.1 restriction endonuclease subunit S [Neisseria meningitidis]MBJ7777434.1 restriction endonuclease subunit S [Neisseria meningitidis]
MNSALKNHATYINNKVDTNEISLSQYISTDNILQNKQGIECATSLPIQGGKVTSFKKGDILLANIRPYLKKIWYAQFDGGCSADVLAIRANTETDSHFLFYALFRDDFFIHAMKGAKGTKMPRGDKTQIMEFKIPVFDLKTQQSIAAVLSTLDKKIALNKQINARLEEMAKTLYDYWFVQFDFPDANGKPYKSSGGEIVFDETLKREIPKGWGSIELQSCLAKIPNTTKILNKDIKDFGKYPVVDQSQDFICGFTNDEKSILNPQDAHIIFGDHTRIVKLVNFQYARGADGTQVILSNNERMPNYLFYQIINQIDLSSYGYARHFKFLKEFKIILPSKDISQKYNEIANTFFVKVRNNIKQNHQLTQLRDFLLPMLMNGQVSVAE